MTHKLIREYLVCRQIVNMPCQRLDYDLGVFVQHVHLFVRLKVQNCVSRAIIVALQRRQGGSWQSLDAVSLVLPSQRVLGQIDFLVYTLDVGGAKCVGDSFQFLVEQASR